MSQDRVFLEGMVFYGYHGADLEERSLGQRFIVDLEVTADLALAGNTDNLQDTVNYAGVFRAVRAIVEGPARHLIEAVAEEIATKVMADFPVEQVRVRIRKPSVAIKGSILTAAGVEIVRQRAP